MKNALGQLLQVTDNLVGTVTYQYDANGNNIGSSDGRTIDYTVFNKAETIAKGGHLTTFAYGPERNRAKRTDSNTSATRTTLYIGGVEKITQADGVSFPVKCTIQK